MAKWTAICSGRMFSKKINNEGETTEAKSYRSQSKN
jgi:hypothetical protein